MTSNNNDFESKVESVVISVMIRSLKGNWENIYGNTIEMSDKDLARTDDELRARHFPLPPFLTRKYALQTKVCMNLLKTKLDDSKALHELLATFHTKHKLSYDYIKGFCAVSCNLSVLMGMADDHQDTMDEGTYLVFCNALKSLNDEGEKFKTAYGGGRT